MDQRGGDDHHRGYAYLAGGLLFGIALFRAHVLARWAAALLAVGGVLSVVLSLMPDAFYRFLAVPNGVAMIGLATRCGAALGRSTTMQPLAVTISAARQQSHSDDITGDDENAAALKAWGDQLTPQVSSSERGSG